MRCFKVNIEALINRRGRETVPVIFDWRRIYVLPSKPGLFFAFIWFVMLMAGLNFNNNMGLMLVFLLFGMAQAILLKTFFNMRNIQLKSIKAEPVFLGESTEVKLELVADDSRWQIACHSGKVSDSTNIKSGRGYVSCPVEGNHRGWQHIPRIKLLTRYPMGLFTVWVYCAPDFYILVYPKPETPVPAYPQHGGLEGQLTLPEKGDEISNIREYHVGDPVRDIAWKKTAQNNKTWVKQFEQMQGQQMLFDFDQMTTLTVEHKLSRLCAWVLQAERQNMDYQLKLCDFCSDMGHGTEQLAQCLKALALYGGGDSSAKLDQN